MMIRAKRTQRVDKKEQNGQANGFRKEAVLYFAFALGGRLPTAGGPFSFLLDLRTTFWCSWRPLSVYKAEIIVYKHRHNDRKVIQSMPPQPPQPQASSASSSSSAAAQPTQDWKAVEVRVPHTNAGINTEKKMCHSINIPRPRSKIVRERSSLPWSPSSKS